MICLESFIAPKKTGSLNGDNKLLDYKNITDELKVQENMKNFLRKQLVRTPKTMSLY